MGALINTIRPGGLAILPPGGHPPAGGGARTGDSARAARAAIRKRMERRSKSENENDLNGRPPIDRDHDLTGVARSGQRPEDQRWPVTPGFAG